MKNIEQILKDAGLEVTEEQKKTINAAVLENYRTINDYNNQAKKLTDAESERDTYKGQLADAQETLKDFDGVNVEDFKKKITDLEEKVKTTEKEAAAKILQRDQRDYLKGEFDKLGISSERTRNSLMRDIMDEKEGLKWKDGAFMGLSDYLAKENEKDHFYQTEEEKKAAEEKAAEEEAKQKAAGSAPKFTDRSEGKPANGDKPTFNFGFTPIREAKKGD